jgi:hypothetical protein
MLNRSTRSAGSELSNLNQETNMRLSNGSEYLSLISTIKRKICLVIVYIRGSQFTSVSLRGIAALAIIVGPPVSAQEGQQ